MELIYKREQGLRSRWTLGLCLLALVVFGALQLHDFLPATWRQPIGGEGGLGTMLGTDFPLTWAFLTAAIMFAAGVAGSFWLCNHRKLVDFLIETETELNKVSWSSKRDVVGASVVVVVTTLLLGAYLAAVDWILVRAFVKPRFWDTIWAYLGLSG